jgi:hypothetical protein
MRFKRFGKPSPAMAVALVALFVALTGTAGAVVSAAVPLAKRALVADNAKKLNGETAAAIVQAASQLPGPAASAAGLVSIKTGQWTLAPNGQGDFTTTCDAGQKVVGGGWDDPNGWAHGWDDRPSADGTSWRMFLTVSPSAPGTQSGGLYAVCVK